MKNLFIILLLAINGVASAQSICLSTMCTAAHAHVGDTVLIGASLTATNFVKSITYTPASTNPAKVVMASIASIPANTAVYQENAQITGLTVPGTYLFTVLGTDQKGQSMPGIDSIVVAPAIPVSSPRTVKTIQVLILGQWITIPAGNAKIVFSDGTTQSY